jgi:hypothetical protein
VAHQRSLRIALRHVAEALKDTNRSSDGKHHEPSEDVPHGGDVGPMVGMHIGLEREIESGQDDREKCAAEPGKISVQEIHRVGVPLGRQPVALVGEIDIVRRQQRDEARDAKSDYRRKNAYAGHYAEEGRFGLPAVWRATRVEVRCQDFR